MKSYLSFILGAVYLKTKGQVICRGEDDDCSSGGNINMPGWPFEKYGYKCVSLYPEYFSLFLGYKIERAVYPGFESDTRFGLNAITDSPRNLRDLTIVVDRLPYLKSNKGGSFLLAGIEEIGAPGLETLIRSKIDLNYIYNLTYEAESDYTLSRFNLMIEVKNKSRATPVRLMCGLKYEPDAGQLRVLTMR